MGENAAQFDIKQLLSYGDDLVGVLRDKRDLNILTYCIDESKSINSSLLSDINATHLSISDYQKKIDDCKHKIEVAQSEEISDEEIERLQKELDDELKREQSLEEELRVIVGQFSDLDRERLSIEEKKMQLKKLEEEHEKDQRKLSFYASVTKIIPNLDKRSKISGHIVNRDKKTLEKFEFDPQQEDAFELCNKTWNMINH